MQPPSDIRAYAVWTIFHYPDERLPFEAVRHIMYRGMALERTAFQRSNLSQARSLVPVELTRFGRPPNTDNYIVEVWY